MSVISKIVSVINHKDFLSYTIALTLSTVLIGYAPSSIALGIFVFFAIRYAVINKKKPKIDRILLLPICLYLFFCVSYVWSVDQQITLKGMGRLIAFLIVPLAFSLIPKFTIKTFKLILNCFTISNVFLGVFFLITAIVNYIKTGVLTVFTYHDLVSVLDLNAIYVSVFFCISFFFLLLKQNKKWFDFIGLAFFSIIILLLSSKMIIVTFVLSNVFYFVIYKGFSALKKVRVMIFLIISSIIFVFASHQLIERVLIEKTTNIEEIFQKEKFSRIYPWTGTSIRLLQLRNLKGQIEEDDIFWKGFGLFASRQNLKERHLAFNTYREFHGYNYHNMYAQILAELGIFGLLTLLAILISGIIKFFKTKYFLFFIFYFLIGMVFLSESFLWVQRGLFLFIIMHCLLNRTDFSILNKPKQFN